MAEHLKNRNDRAYWEGVQDGVAELTSSVSAMYREGIEIAEREHERKPPLPPELDLIRRDKVVAFLKSQARRMEGFAAQIGEILEGKLPSDPREES